jgi:hypothetical protein
VGESGEQEGERGRDGGGVRLCGQESGHTCTCTLDGNCPYLKDDDDKGK